MKTRSSIDEERTRSFQFLLRAATSPTTAPMLNLAVQELFLAPIREWLGGADAEAGAVFTIAVSGANPLSDYSVTLEQVASRTDALRASLSGYKVTLSAGSQ